MLRTNILVKMVFLLSAILVSIISCQSVSFESPTSHPTRPTGTATLSNEAILDELVKTPELTPIAFASPNETGIIPGHSTEDQVSHVLGEPTRKNVSQSMTIWNWRRPIIQHLESVSFSQGIVQEITLEVESATAETIVAEQGIPELVVMYPKYEQSTLATPVTSAPFGPPFGFLVYPSKGILFEIYCDPGFIQFRQSCPSVQSCTGVPRQIPVILKKYFIPTTIIQWVRQQPRSDRAFCIRPWTGFSD